MENAEMYPDEIYSASISGSDIIIAVLGITGAGKSTFVSALTDLDTGIGNSLAPETAQIRIYSYFEESGRRVFLVDTPGFDDSVRLDVDVLQEQIFFFTQLYKAGVPLAGIVYLHPISKNRIGGSSMKNFRLLEQMCGSHALDRVVLLTTMWDQVHSGTTTQQTLALQRQQELVSNEQFWGNMVSHGSQALQFDGSKQSAQRAVDILVSRYTRDGPVAFQVQREMLEGKQEVWDTSAARQVTRELNRIKDDASRELHHLREAENRLHGGLVSQIAEEKTALEKTLQDIAEANRRLLASFEDILNEKEARFARISEQGHREYREQLQLLQQEKAKLERLEEEEQESIAIYQSSQDEQHKARVSATRPSYDEHFTSSYKQDRQRIRKNKAKLDDSIKAKKRKTLLIQNIMPMLQILGGIGCVAGGAVSMVMPVAAVGATLLASGMSGVRFSTKEKRKPPLWKAMVAARRGERLPESRRDHICHF